MKLGVTITKALLGGSVIFLLTYSFASPTATQTCTPPPMNMVSWWPGDGNADDIAGTNAGTLQNGATFATGKVGQAFDVRAANAHISILANPSLQVSSLTIDAWINPAAFIKPGANPSGFNSNIILSNSGPVSVGICGGSGPGTGICDSWLGPGQVGRLYGFVRTGGTFDGQWRLSNVALPLNQWSHVTMTYDGTLIRLYLNGAEISTFPIIAFGISWTKTGSPNYASCTGCGASIGAYRPSPSSTPSDLFHGFIDEAELFNRVLSATEIQDIYNAGSVGKCKNNPPIAMCQNVTVSAGSDCTANASIDNGSFDPDGDMITITQVPAGPYPLGTTSATLTVTDSNGASSSCIATVTVVDSAAPVVTSSVTQSSLWPPNHNLVNVGLTGSASDNCTANPAIQVLVFSDEDDETPSSDGNHSPDAKNIGLSTLRLRTERDGGGDGRVYLIVVKATDAGQVGQRQHGGGTKEPEPGRQELCEYASSRSQRVLSG